ncbi:alpha-tectorin-like [Spea bombifrons]|uniref:alpha-tectorin-like n=1 Tax=Spea bombifrons TaxID=233779 RepID=UPI00234A4863|nr:alpha-tectorin-like [Spea bombifrons]
MRSLPLLIFAVTLWLGGISADGESTLYPYGPSVGDKITPVADDGATSAIPISVPFTFFGRTHKSLYVNNNGVVSFGVSVSKYTPDAFPLADGSPFVAPFWADVDNRLGGKVYYRETTDPPTLQRITHDINKYFPNLHYKAKWVFVATWDKVAYFSSLSKKTNTFQAVLSTDGKRSFIILNYGDVTWTTGAASGGNRVTGLGGTPAQAGFNSGDKTHYFNIPGSRTDEIINIGHTSNVNVPGRWVFQVDAFKAPGGCVFEANFARYNDTFWKDETCETKCVCNTDGEVACTEESCPASLVCQPSAWRFTCQISLGSCF